MSLHQKIVWLFIGVALVPLVVFSVLAREQSLTLADFAAEADLLSEAVGASRSLASEKASARAALTSLAGLPIEALDDAFLRRVIASGVGPRPLGFQALMVVDSGGVAIAGAGDSSVAERCVGGRGSTLVQVTEPLETGSGMVVGSYWVAVDPGMVAGDEYWVLDEEAGRTLAVSPCGAARTPLEALLPADSALGVLPVRDARDPDRKTVFVRVADSDWVVIASGTSMLSGPLTRFFRNYWLFLLALALAAILAFSSLLRRVTGGLSDLTRAVEAVAAGEMRPWLPTPRDDEIGRLTLAFSDMTDRLRETLDQVERTGRLAVLGKLSAYLAHEIRNPLSSVKMNLQRLQRWQRQGEIPDRCGNAIEVSLAEVGRLSSAVSNVLQLSPAKAQHAELVSLHGVVSEALRLLERDLERAGITVELNLDASTDRVAGNPGQLKGVLINLLLNALDAQPDGGTLSISSALRAHGREMDGARVELRLRDSGPGVPAEVAERIFEPFFTTKDVGSGIGLAVASQTVRDHGGELYLEPRSRVDEGAEFVLSLPLAPAGADAARVAVPPTTPRWVDDGPEA